MDEPYIIERTRKTPYICFDQTVAKLELKGNSLPADSQEFYTPLLQMIEEYIKNPTDQTELIFHLGYFNTSSSKIILQILLKFEVLNSMGKQVTFTWYYDEDDLDMYDAGKTYQASINIPTVLTPISAE